MKTKSFLFAALISISFATTSCQKEESILPNIDHSVIYAPNAEGSTTIINSAETLDSEPKEKPQRVVPVAISEQTNPDSVIVNVMQINVDNIK